MLGAGTVSAQEHGRGGVLSSWEVSHPKLHWKKGFNLFSAREVSHTLNPLKSLKGQFIQRNSYQKQSALPHTQKSLVFMLYLLIYLLIYIFLSLYIS
ncbi:hypothetical protein FKM82_005683 [Ascaphus truei]